MKRIALTMGDPAGIGAEVILKTLKSKQVLPEFIPILIGDENILNLNNEILNYNIKFVKIDPSDVDSLKELPYDSCYLINESKLSSADFQFGVVDAKYGKAAGDYIKRAADLAANGKIDAIVTAPINKKAFNLGGYNFQGHTDFLAHLTGSDSEVMMLAGGKLRVILCTVHVALKEAISLLNEELIIKTVTVANNDFKKYFDMQSPKFALAALNPHASEGGSFGNEEADFIKPAAERLRAAGIDITDPLPSDSLFYHAKNGEYDAVICMYHDQGLIPIKVLYFDTGTNITLGLDIIRTSVDHGTAFEIAGMGEANEMSMINAIESAIEMCENKRAE